MLEVEAMDKMVEVPIKDMDRWIVQAPAPHSVVLIMWKAYHSNMRELELAASIAFSNKEEKVRLVLGIQNRLDNSPMEPREVEGAEEEVLRQTVKSIGAASRYFVEFRSPLVSA